MTAHRATLFRPRNFKLSPHPARQSPGAHENFIYDRRGSHLSLRDILKDAAYILFAIKLVKSRIGSRIPYLSVYVFLLLLRLV